MIRYFFNIKTGQFIQIANTTLSSPFNNNWVEISKDAFDYLMRGK